MQTKKQNKPPKQACNLGEMSDTSLHSHCGLWLKFSEAALARRVDAKHNKNRAENQLGEALPGVATRSPSGNRSALPKQPNGLTASCRAQPLLMAQVPVFCFFFFNKRLMAENILWQTEIALKSEEMNPFINSQKLMTLSDENGGKKKKAVSHDEFMSINQSFLAASQLE